MYRKVLVGSTNTRRSFIGALMAGGVIASAMIVTPVAAQQAPQTPVTTPDTASPTSGASIPTADSPPNAGIAPGSETVSPPANAPAAAAIPGNTSPAEQTQGDIVVTANRTSSLASKTPIALTAIGGDALRSAGVTSTVDLAAQVPNLSIDRTSGIQITIRGVTSTDTSEKGDPSAAFLVDGVYIARTQAQDTSFFDVERVEVLRGPQGTLYGRNTTAGVVNVITNKPTQQLEAAANGTIGNYGTYQGDAMLNLPVTDTIAIRGAVSYDRRDSYLIKGVASPFGLNPYKNYITGRLQALWKIGSNASLLIRGDYSQLKGNYAYNTLASQAFDLTNPQSPVYTGNGSSKIRTLSYAQTGPSINNNNTWGIGGELNWDFGPLTLSYLGSYREFKRDEGFVGNIGIAVSGPFTGNYWQNSQELRFATNGSGPLKLQFGAYYFKEKSDIALYLLGLQDFVGAPYYGFPQHTSSESYAFFGQTTYSLTDTLRVTGGLRYSHDDKARNGGTVFQQTQTFNPSTDTLLLNYATRTFQRVTWRGGIDFDAGPRTLVYGSVSTGYKAGGFNDGCLAGTSYKGLACNQIVPENILYYAPETLTSYEIGIKTRTADNKLRANIAAFHYDYSNLQLSQLSISNGGPVQVTQNAAKARVTGVELETVLAPDQRNRVDITFTYLDGHYAAYLPLGTGGPNFADRKLDRSPTTSVSAGYTYNLPLGEASLVASVRSRLSAAYALTNFSAAAQFRQPSYTRTDASLQYNAPSAKWYTAVFVRNLENYITVTAVDGANNISPGDPRTYGVRGGFHF